MNDLLQLAVNAHGGLKRWNEISKITVAASLTGGDLVREEPGRLSQGRRDDRRYEEGAAGH